jgi:LysR family transcriptional regulator, regulator for genes of the gallate degradation pathway
MDPKRLLELLSIAEAGTFTRAAKMRGVSQPALSSSMALLEKSLGVRVLERSRNGAVLTDYGQVLATHAQALTTLLARASTDVQLKRRGLQGRLAVGASPLACTELVPNAIERMCRDCPDVDVQIFEHSDDQLLHGLRTGELDVVVSPAGARVDPADVITETLLDDVAVVVIRPRHPLAPRKKLALAELRDARWIFPDVHTGMWRHIEALFAAAKVPLPESCLVTNSIIALRSLLMRTDCVSISSPRLFRLELKARQLAAVPLASPFAREIVMRTRRHVPQTPLGERLVTALRAEAAVLRKRA